MGELDGERIIITGASSGTGRSMASRFLEEGARVALVARSVDSLERLAGEVDGETVVAPADVRRAGEVAAAVERVVEAFGGVDTLVNNAGVGLVSRYGHGTDVVDVSEPDWDLVVDVNLKGCFLFSREVLPCLIERGRGNVVNITSTFATAPKAGWGPYVSSKFGLLGLTKTMALEVESDGVNVNSLHPGGKVATGFWDHLPEGELDTIPDPDVMNDAATLLAAQGPAGVTGEHHDADGWERRLD